MKVIVDTPIWSLAMRRHKPSVREADALAELLRDDRAVLLGMVRQELLSGVSDPTAYRQLRQTLRSRPDYTLEIAHYEVAAESYNTCRARGVQGSPVDFLLCAASMLDHLPIFTTDKDFDRYAKHLPIKRFVP